MWNAPGVFQTKIDQSDSLHESIKNLLSNECLFNAPEIFQIWKTLNSFIYGMHQNSSVTEYTELFIKVLNKKSFVLIPSE